jgi:FkbM family methyltransferase
MATQRDIDNIHNYHYTFKIRNKNGTNNYLIEDDTLERLVVEEFAFVVSKYDTCVSDCLRTGKLFEQFLLSFVKQFIPEDKNILDIGANIGVHSVIYSNYTKKTVYAFEPQPKVFDLLEKNIKGNNCKNIVPHMFGASSQNTTFFMNAVYDQKINQGAFRIKEKDSPEEMGITIQCKVLDELNLQDIGYIKMDVEGHELEALEGLTNTINRYRPSLMIEIHDSSPTKSETLDFIKKHGYTKFWRLTHCDYIFV